MIKREKWVEIGEIHLYNTIECFCFKCGFHVKNHEFKKCVINKRYPFIYDLEHECIIDIMYDQGVIKRYVNTTHSCKLCVKNGNFRIINQCM
jgi:hypothetical protein